MSKSIISFYDTCNYLGNHTFEGVVDGHAIELIRYFFKKYITVEYTMNVIRYLNYL